MSAPRERRRWPRAEPCGGGPASHARLRAGADLRVRDISRGGARVEGHARLLPGVHADLHLVGAGGRQLVRGRVVWARVRAVAPLEYEAALAFDAPFELLPEGYDLPVVRTVLVEPPVAGYPRQTGERDDRHKRPDKSLHGQVGKALGLRGGGGRTLE